MIRKLLKAMLMSAAFSLPLLAADSAGDHIVGQKNKAFTQDELTVKVGEKIIFKNDDDVRHNVFSKSEGFEFNLKMQAPGTESTISFDKEGTVEVRCALHPKMKLIVHVQN